MLNSINFDCKKMLIIVISIFWFSEGCSVQRFGYPIDSLRIVMRYLPERPVVLEAGAFDGSETVALATLYPDGKIYSFEPVPDIYEKLLEKAKPVKNIKTYQMALSDMNGFAKFYVSEEAGVPGVSSQSSSLLAPKEHLYYCPDILFKHEITVPAMTIDDWAEKEGVDHIDFMWLDMQGAELKALMAAPKILKTVKVILTEVEFVEAYEGQALYPEVKSWLEGQGFELIAVNFDLNNPPWFADALFARK
jgi:FkbM family methyltransferase